MSTIHVDIVTPEGELFSGDANMVVVPASGGEIGITPRHAPLLTTLRAGNVRLLIEGRADQIVAVQGGFLEVQPHCISIFASSMGNESKDIKSSFGHAGV